MTEAEWTSGADPPSMLAWVTHSATRRKMRLYLCGGCRQIPHLFYDRASLDAVEVAERDVDGKADREEVGRAAWCAESPTFGSDFHSDFWHAYPEPPVAVLSRLVEIRAQTDPQDTIAAFLQDPEIRNWLLSVRGEGGATLTGTGRIHCLVMALSRREALPRLVELGALSESALTGGEWEVDKTIRDRLLAAARIAEETVLRPYAHSRRIILESISRIQAVWPGRRLLHCVFGNPFLPVRVDRAWLTRNNGAVPRLAREIYDERAFDRLPSLAGELQRAGCRSHRLLAHCRGGGPHVRGCWALDSLLGLR